MLGILVKKMLCLELPSKWRRGRPKTRFMDVVRGDMRVVGVVGEIGDWPIHCGDP